MVHHLLKPLAERAPTDSSCALQVREGELPDAGHHPVLLHHGVGQLGHLLQVILCSWAGETDAMLANSEPSARRALSSTNMHCTNMHSTASETRGPTGAHGGEHSTC